MKHWRKILIAGLLIGLFIVARAAAAEDSSFLEPTTPAALPAYTAEEQTSSLFADEAMTVYLGNLERRKAGVPPLRWNRELSLAARWFAWDSVENRPVGFCDHVDTLGGLPVDRALWFGYLGLAGAENAFCDYVTPADAIQGWIASAGHRENLLNPGAREVGLGYYRRASDGSGYVVQDFGQDSLFPPLIIENELPSTTNALVRLYQHSSAGSGGISEMGPATQMRIGDSACLTDAAWQAYQPEPSWTLPGGAGWKTVHAQIRDRLGRTSTASDSIYYGSSLPADELSLAQLSETTSVVNLFNLDGLGLPYAQFSLGWAADNSDANFELLWGRGTQVNDAAALGGTAFRLEPSPDYESTVWVWTAEFVPNTPLVAYFRLKTSANTSGDWVARLTVEANEVAASRTIKGTDFKAADQYQEFTIPFQYQANPDKPFLIFKVARNNSATNQAAITFDAATIFSASQAFDPVRTTWNIPGGHYRGQGIWVRYADGSGNFTAWQEAATHAPLEPRQTSVLLLAEAGLPSLTAQVEVARDCLAADWEVAGRPDWLEYRKDGDRLEVWAGPGSLGTYTGELVLQTGSPSYTVAIPVRLLVVEELSAQLLPAITR